MQAATLVVLLATITFSYAATKIPTATLKKIFNEADCDHDGKLTLKETVALGVAFGTPEAKTTTAFKAGDTDKDGKISFKEYEAAINAGCCSVTRKPGAKKLCS